MATLSGSDFATYTVNDASLGATNGEYILDRAINLIVLYGEDINISNPQGTTGSKSLTVSQKTKAAIELAARAIYASYWMNAANKNSAISTLNGTTVGDLMSTPAVLAAIKEAAKLLRERDWSRSII